MRGFHFEKDFIFSQFLHRSNSLIQFILADRPPTFVYNEFVFFYEINSNLFMLQVDRIVTSYIDERYIRYTILKWFRNNSPSIRANKSAKHHLTKLTAD